MQVRMATAEVTPDGANLLHAMPEWLWIRDVQRISDQASESRIPRLGRLASFGDASFPAGNYGPGTPGAALPAGRRPGRGCLDYLKGTGIRDGTRALGTTRWSLRPRTAS